MTRNPCRNCEKAYIDPYGRHTSSYKCHYCEKWQKHMEYLENKRMYVKGDKITTLEELLNQEFIMWHGKATHIEVIKSLQLRMVLNTLESGYFYSAVKRENEGTQSGKNKREVRTAERINL